MNLNKLSVIEWHVRIDTESNAARRYVMANKRNLSMSEDDYDDDVDTWEPTENYPTRKSWEDDNWSLMYPDGIDDGEYFDD